MTCHSIDTKQWRAVHHDQCFMAARLLLACTSPDLLWWLSMTFSNPGMQMQSFAPILTGCLMTTRCTARAYAVAQPTASQVCCLHSILSDVSLVACVAKAVHHQFMPSRTGEPALTCSPLPAHVSCGEHAGSMHVHGAMQGAGDTSGSLLYALDLHSLATSSPMGTPKLRIQAIRVSQAITRHLS
jgi:hypothetical protein